MKKRLKELIPIFVVLGAIGSAGLWADYIANKTVAKSKIVETVGEGIPVIEPEEITLDDCGMYAMSQCFYFLDDELLKIEEKTGIKPAEYFTFGDLIDRIDLIRKNMGEKEVWQISEKWENRYETGDVHFSEILYGLTDEIKRIKDELKT